MHPVQVQFDDQHYRKAQQRANEAGFKTVEEYVVDVVTNDLDEEIDNLDHLFTAERLAIIDNALEEVKKGEVFTPDQVDASLAKTKEAWLQKNRR